MVLMLILIIIISMLPLSKDMQRHGNLRFYIDFMSYSKSVSHYTVDKDGSERLMLK